MTNKYPTQSTVTRALFRDTGLRNAPTGRQGYHVRGGGTYMASIFVDLSDLVDSAVDRRYADDLHAHLLRCGWDVTRDESNRVLVRSVPTAAEARKAARWRVQRQNAYTDWQAADAEHDRRPSARTIAAEQKAWERYTDACAVLNECIEPDCHNHTPEHVYCEEHRPK